MAGRSRNRKPYKKQLSIFELRALADEHKDSPVFVTNPDGECALEIWLKELRFRQAWQVAEWILGEDIEQQYFQDCWANTQPPKPKKESSEPSNTATFGGYRLKRRAALNRASKGRGPKKQRRRW